MNLKKHLKSKKLGKIISNYVFAYFLYHIIISKEGN